MCGQTTSCLSSLLAQLLHHLQLRFSTLEAVAALVAETVVAVVATATVAETVAHARETTAAAVRDDGQTDQQAKTALARAA
jgi:hypothetical protein